MKKNIVKFIDSDGAQEVTLGLSHWQAAQDSNLSLRQFVNTKYPTTPDAKHDTFTQMCQSVGMYTKPARELGIRPISMKEIENGGLEFGVGMQGSEVSPVQTKILFPAVIAELVENKLQFDRMSAVAAFDQMLADVYSVAGRRIEQPYIDYTRAGGPESARNQARAQGAEPATMMTIKAGEKTLTIGETPLAVTVTDEAMQATTIDMVALAMTRQAEVESYTRIGEDLLSVLQGNADAGSYGTSALSSVTAASFDSSISAAGALTDYAYAKWLYTGIEKRRINYIVTDYAGAWAIQNRSVPVQTNTANSMVKVEKKETDTDVVSSIFYPSLVNNVQIFVVPSTAGWPVNTLMGFDSRYAMRKWVNTLATYSDVERYVLRRASTFVVSFGSKVTRYFDDSFSVLTLTV